MNKTTYNAITCFLTTGDVPKGLSYHQLYAFKKKARMFRLHARTKKLYFEKRIVIKEENVKKTIDDYYYSATTGFWGRDKMYSILNQTFYGITKATIADYLKNQELNQVTTPQKKYRVTHPIICAYPNERWQIDLIDAYYPSLNGIKYHMNIVDHHTKYAWSFPLKDKSSSTVADNLKSLFDKGYKPDILQSDNGKEFLGEVSDLCDKYKVNQINSLPYTPTSQGLVERFNKTLKGLIQKYMMNNQTKVYFNVMDNLVYNYNHSVHSTTGLTPDDAYMQEKKVDMQKVIKKANKMIKDEDTTDIKKGDYVRVSMFNPKSKLVKKETKQYSTDIYEVYSKSRDKVPRYELVGLSKPYYHYQLLKVKNSKEIQKPKVIQGKDDTYYHRKEKGLNSIIK